MSSSNYEGNRERDRREGVKKAAVIASVTRAEGGNSTRRGGHVGGEDIDAVMEEVIQLEEHDEIYESDDNMQYHYLKKARELHFDLCRPLQDHYTMLGLPHLLSRRRYDENLANHKQLSLQILHV